MEIEYDVNDKTFEEKVIKKSYEKPVVVDFWASWCMPCLILKPTLEKIAKEYKGRFILAKVNVDEAEKMAKVYNVSSVPNVKFFKNGKVVDEFVGAIPEGMIKKWIEKNLG
jgi:putative thioredoxin